LLPGAGTRSGTKASKNHRRAGSAPSPEFAANGAHLLAQFDAQANGIVPQNLAGFSLHHLGADVEGREQR
jgi:hypothetical protein